MRRAAQHFFPASLLRRQPKDPGVLWAIADVVGAWTWGGRPPVHARGRANVSLQRAPPTAGYPVSSVARRMLHTDHTALRSLRTQAGERVGRAL